jgi:tetratricopeptide (TPR) repeat protein
LKFQKVIPNVAKNLDENPISQVELLGRVLHREGVNMRHLGFIRSAVCNEKIKEFILLEAIARTIKSHLNELLRVEMRRCGIPSQEPFLKLVLDLFNLILLNNGEYSSAYWNNQLIPHLLEKFPKLLSLEEQQAEYQLWTKISFFDLFSRLQIITAVKISSEAMTELSKSPARFEFVEPDIVALNTRVAHLNLIDYADGMALYYEAENRVSNLDTQRRLLQLARIRLESCLESMANNTVAMLQLSNILRVMASKLKNESEQLECFEKACSGFETITKSSPDESIKRKAHFLWAKTLWTKTKRAFHTRSSEEQILSAFLNQIQQARNIDPESSDPIILLVKSILFRAKRESPKASIALLQQAQKILQEFQSSFSWDWDLHVIQARVAFYQFRNYFHSNETPCEEEQKLLEPQFICKMFEKIETTSPGGLEKVFKDLDDIQNFPESAFSPAFICSQFSDVVSERLAKFLAQQSVTKLCFNSLNLAQIQNFKIFRKIFEITLSLTSLKFTNLKWLSNFVEIFFDCHAPISFLECSDCAGMTVNDFKIILEHLPGLRELRVSHSTSITHLDWISVIPAIPAELTSLELEAIEHLNDSVVSQLVSHCPKLTCLLLKDLSGISNQVFRVIQSLTNLEQLKVIQCSEVNDTSAIESFSAPISILQLLGTGYQYSGSSKLSKLMPLKYLTCSNGDLHLFTSERVSCNTTLSSIKSIVSLTASGFGHFIQVNSTMVGPSHFYNVIIKNPQLPFTNNETQLFKYTTSAFGPSIRVNVDVKGSQSFQTNFPAKSASMVRVCFVCFAKLITNLCLVNVERKLLNIRTFH